MTPMAQDTTPQTSTPTRFADDVGSTPAEAAGLDTMLLGSDLVQVLLPVNVRHSMCATDAGQEE